MKIREAKHKDWPIIREMITALHEFEMQYDPRYDINKKTGNFLEKWLKSNLKKNPGKLFVASEGKEIAGFSVGWIVSKDSSTYSKEALKTGYIALMFVKEQYRGLRLGWKLAQKLIDFFRAKKIRYILLSVYNQNYIAQNLYSALGFKELENTLLLDLTWSDLLKEEDLE